METPYSWILARDANSDNVSPYNYIPTEAVCAIFIALYGLSTLIHAGQALRFRLWYIFPTVVLGGVLEILGWSSRLWSSKNVLASTPFSIQITSTILAPTPILAANFIILSRIILILGPQYSRLSPRRYSAIFLTCDIVSLFIQGSGGGLASSEANNNENTSLGSNLILGGIIFQLATISVFAILGSEFFIRYSYKRPIRELSSTETAVQFMSTKDSAFQRTKIISVALCFSTVVLFIRAVYRTIELADGWKGRIISTQVYFNVLDGAMVVLAIYTFNFVHPGVFLRPFEPSTGSAEASLNASENKNSTQGMNV